jgi:hypothetical protein
MDFQQVLPWLNWLELKNEVKKIHILKRFLPECASRSSIKLADTISETTSGTVSVALLNSNLISCKSPCEFLNKT